MAMTFDDDPLRCINCEEFGQCDSCRKEVCLEHDILDYYIDQHSDDMATCLDCGELN